MPGSGPGEPADSFAEFVAERDIECPGCGYNLRGLKGRRCPECGARVGWGAFAAWGPDSEPRLFRMAEAGVVVGATLAAGQLAFRAWGALASGKVGPIVASVLLPLAALAGAGLWLRVRGRAAKWPRHVQGRVATAAWIVFGALALVAMGAGAV